MGRDGPRDFEKDLLSMSATMVGRRKKYYVSDGLKGQNNVEFLAKYFYPHLQIFSNFV